jgi:four helix bundle protein
MRTMDGINVWNRACDFAIQTYKTLSSIPDSSLRDQITRTSLAVASNIAEGYEHKSPRQFCQYLDVAKGFCVQLRTHLYVAGELGFIDSEQSTSLIAESLELSTMLQSLINWCQKKAIDEPESL